MGGIFSSPTGESHVGGGRRIGSRAVAAVVLCAELSGDGGDGCAGRCDGDPMRGGSVSLRLMRLEFLTSTGLCLAVL